MNLAVVVRDQIELLDVGNPHDASDAVHRGLPVLAVRHVRLKIAAVEPKPRIEGEENLIGGQLLQLAAPVCSPRCSVSEAAPDWLHPSLTTLFDSSCVTCIIALNTVPPGSSP